MGKRGNENAQLSKEDYDALENKGSSSDGLQQGFSRASQEELATRRIVRSTKKYVHNVDLV
jgi:NUP50 (Nucleoporin 50 kDa)